MTDIPISTARTRRRFLADLTHSAAAGVLVFQLPVLATLAGCARDAEDFAHLTAAEARAMRAFAAQILPSEPDSPGAEEAGAVFFVDRAFGDPHFAEQLPVIRAGLADLDARARDAGARHGFASLSDAEQRTIIGAIAKEPFFAAARTLVLIGTFADSSHGGNRGGAGLKIVGMEHRASYTAPYGWYDAQPSGSAA